MAELGLELGSLLGAGPEHPALARCRQGQRLAHKKGGVWDGVLRAGFWSRDEQDPLAGPWRLPRTDAEFHGHLPPDTMSVCDRRAPGSSQKRLERRSVILYDCSEEELMASIEQEYCH